MREGAKPTIGVGAVVRTALTVLAACVIGFLLRGLLPAVVPDDAFWRAFWTGPPMAGILAVIAALIAFNPARRASRIAQETAARQAWWDRAEWALNLAGSSERPARLAGFRALSALADEATSTELQMIAGLIEAVETDLELTAREAQNVRAGRGTIWRKARSD